MIAHDPIRVIVIDDEPPARSRLEDLVRSIDDAELVGAYSDAEQALAAIEEVEPDVAFVDVQMPGVSGLEMVRCVPAVRRPVLVFVTAYRRHAPDAFEVAATDYLLKPYDDERFQAAYQRARDQVRMRRVDAVGRTLARLAGDQPTGRSGIAGAPSPEAGVRESLQRIAVERAGKTLIIPVDNIDHIEAAGPYMKLHVRGEQYLLRERMKHLDRALDPTRFCRIHRSTIVRLDAIRALTPHWRGDYVVHLNDGTPLKLSRTRREVLERRLGISL